MSFDQNYKLVMEYDGTRYEGWQRQNKPGTATIQGKIEDVLGKFCQSPVSVHGSGRTDAGVHARGQVANVHLPGNYEEQALLVYLNHYLPEDIKILAVSRVGERFHARLSAVKKTYCYYLDQGSKKAVFERKYVYGFPHPLDLTAMRQAAGYLVGTHDFKSFCGNKKTKKSTVRTIEAIEINQQQEKISITYVGSGFLQYMVRIITGTLLEVGSGQRRPETMPAILTAKDRTMAGFTAPAQGLFLHSVDYHQEKSNH